MKNTLEYIRSKLKPKKLNYGSNFSIELGIDDKDVQINPVAQINDIKKAEKELNFEFPPSFKTFLMEVGNGVEIEKGNCLTVFPLYNKNKDFFGIVSLTEEFKSYEQIIESDFVCFGMSGVDSETFAFFTGYRYKNGEYPIVFMIPGELDGKTFFHITDSFDSFLTLQYFSLIHHEDIGLSDIELLALSPEGELDEEQEILERKKSILKSYGITKIQPVLDEYENLMSGAELKDKLVKANNIT